MTIQATGSYVSYNKPKDHPKKPSKQLALSRHVSKRPPDLKLVKRLELTKSILQNLNRNIPSGIEKSRFLERQECEQEIEKRVTQLFYEFFAYAHGTESLAVDGAYQLIDIFSHMSRKRVGPPYNAHHYYSDVYGESRRLYGDGGPSPGRGGGFDGDFAIHRFPSSQVIDRLKAIIEENNGLFDDFLALFKQKRLSVKPGVEISHILPWDERSFAGIFHGLFIGATLGSGALLYSKFGDNLKELYSALLAVKWLEEDKRKLEGQPSLTPSIYKEMSQQQLYYFDCGGILYIKRPTSPDGACAMHALLGEKIGGQYQYSGPGNVRKAFVNKLIEQIGDLKVQQMLAQIIKDHLEKSSKIDPETGLPIDPSSYRLFPYEDELGLQCEYALLKASQAEDFKRLNTREALLWEQELFENEDFKSRVIAHSRQSRHFRRMSPEQVLSEIRRNPLSILRIVYPETPQFLELVAHPGRKHALFWVSQERIRLREYQDMVRDQRALRESVFKRYIETVQNDAFWFNEEEIALAAYLFGRSVKVFDSIQSEIPTAELIQPDPNIEIISIVHEGGRDGGHFSRLTAMTEEEIRERISFRNARNLYQAAQKAANEQIKYDEQMQKLFESTVKQEVGQLAVSSGATLCTGNPLFIGSQAVKSATNIGITYFDPYRENLLSKGIDIVALPVFKVATGDQLQSVVISLGVDLSAKMVLNNAPEGAKRLITGPITPFVEAAICGSSNGSDPGTKIISGLFGGAIKCGMDGAFHMHEKYWEIDEAYWMNDPSWLQCLVKAIGTNDDLQQVMAGRATDRFVKAFEVEQKELDKPADEVAEAVVEEVDADEVLEEVQPAEPVINLEVQAHIQFLNQYERGPLVSDLVEANAGVTEAQKKVDEKYAAWQKAWKKHPEDIDKTDKSLQKARGNLRNFTSNRDEIQGKLNRLDQKIAGLEARLYSPMEEQDYLNKVADVKPYVQELQRQEALKQQQNSPAVLQANLAKTEKAEAKAKKEMDAAQKKADFLWSLPLAIGYGKAADKLAEKKENYKAAVEAANVARAACNLSPKAPQPPKQLGIYEVTDKVSNFLRKIGVESIDVNVTLMETSSPKPTEGSTYLEGQMNKALEGLPTDEVMGRFNSQGILVDRPQPKQLIDKPKDLSGLLPSSTSNGPMIGDTPASNWGWSNAQSYQDFRTIQAVQNAIANRPALPSTGPLDLNNPTRSIELAHRELWGQGFLNRDVELKLPSMQQAGFSLFEGDTEGGMDLHVLVDNDFVKTVPKGWGRIGIAALKLLVPDMSDVPGAEDPHSHLDRVAQNVGRMYDEIVHIEDLNSFAAKAGTFVGECMAVSPVFKITRLAQLPGVFCAIAEGGTVGAIFAQADNQSPLEGAFIGSAIGGGLHKLVGLFQFSKRGMASLMNRAEPIGIRPLSDEAAFLKRMNNPVYRSGVTSENRVVHQINPVNRSNNHQVITWIENGQTRTASIGEMNHAGTFHDRGGLTKAGRALDKHGQRPDMVFPKAMGNIHEKNMQGQKVLDEILKHPDKQVFFKKVESLNYEECIDIWHPDGYGARFTKDGKKMIGFLDP